MTNLKAICCLVVLIIVGFIWACTPGNQTSNNSNGSNNATPPPAAGVQPVPFPNPGIPGFNFPEKADVIDGWVKDGKNAEIYNHGWGIWAGLTTATTQVPPGGTEPLLVYETWLTPAEIIAATKKQPAPRSNRANIRKPRQFSHALLKAGATPPVKLAAANSNSNSNSNSLAPVIEQPPVQEVGESVSYSPPAAKYAQDNAIFSSTTLFKLYAEKKMPVFPSDSITLKPTFKVIYKDKLNDKGLFPIYSWHGAKELPDDTSKVDTSYPESQWATCIYIDIKNGAKGDGSQDKGCKTPTPGATYNLNDFIHYTMNQEDADFYNGEQQGVVPAPPLAKAGDIAILVGMHVATRETTKWTWQTFYWAADPQDPKDPSSAEIAKARPSQITGAAAHYGMAVAYAMVFPVQPDTGGQSVGQTIYGYNPYLEAPFGNGYGEKPGNNVFAGSTSVVIDDKKKIMTDAGVRTNCMSCHALASVQGNNPCVNNTFYTGDAYISLDDPVFTDQLKVDFAWSIQGNVQNDGPATCPTPTPTPAPTSK